MVRLAIVEDHEVVRIGLIRTFESDPEITVVGDVGSCVDAKELVEREGPDVVLMDMRLPDGDGVEACRDILKIAPDTRILILTSFPEKKAVREALEAGACGFMLKDSGAPEIRDAVHAVARGKYLLDPQAMSWVLRDASDNAGAPRTQTEEVLGTLTPRERDILELIGDGLTNQQIARELCLSLQTVKNYVSSLLSKLSMARRTEAAAYIARIRAEQETKGSY